MPFDDRRDAGRRLASALAYVDAEDLLVVALPNGGVVVGDEIARALGAPLDVLAVHPLTLPEDDQTPIGAIGPGGARFLDIDQLNRLDPPEGELEAMIAEAEEAVEATARRLRGSSTPLELRGRTVILATDAIQSGAKARLAIRILRSQGPKRLILAVPVAANPALSATRDEVDAQVFLVAPEQIDRMEDWYRTLPRVSEADVHDVLEAARARLREAGQPAMPPPEVEVRPAEPLSQTNIEVDLGDTQLEALLGIPAKATGLILVAPDGGASRYSPRGQHLAEALREAGLATLQVDLLTPAEAAEDARSQRYRYDLGLMADRLIDVAGWAAGHSRTRMLPLGLLGTGTAAAIGLLAARQRPDRLRAVACLEGHLEMVQGALPEVQVPVLMLSSDLSPSAQSAARRAMEALGGPVDHQTIAAHGDLLEDPEALDAAAEAAGSWFVEHLAPPLPATPAPDNAAEA